MPRANRSVTEPINPPVTDETPESTPESGATVDISGLTEDQYAVLGVTEQEFNELPESDQMDMLKNAGIELTPDENGSTSLNADEPATTDEVDAGDAIQEANEDKVDDLRKGDPSQDNGEVNPDVTVGGIPQRGLNYDPANPTLEDEGRNPHLPINSGEVTEKSQPHVNNEAAATEEPEQDEIEEVKMEGSQSAEERAKVNTVQAPEPIKHLNVRPIPKAALEMAAPVVTESPEPEVRQSVYAPVPAEAHKMTNSSLEVAEYQNENHPASAHGYVKTNDNPQQAELRPAEMAEPSHYQNPRNPGETMVAQGKAPNLSEGQLQIKFAEGQQAMRKELESQPRVKFFVPLSPGDPKGAQEFVGINGLFMWVPKGRYIDVPEQVAEILAESLSIDMTAGEDFRMDRDENKQTALTGTSQVS
jgi:hypothetical protein